MLFETDEKMVAADVDDWSDVYERSAGVTTLISRGVTAGGDQYFAYFVFASADATSVLFLHQ